MKLTEEEARELWKKNHRKVNLCSLSDTYLRCWFCGQKRRLGTVYCKERGLTLILCGECAELFLRYFDGWLEVRRIENTW